ncbi:MAG: TetR/AcrR family transcriptional regulator [Rhodobacteraceae bacterium]|nr:TetR/AcrR family transcriptional regulator [Paracoccaceae bacterium]
MSPEKHHHGNLREALITAGIELLETGGLEALTLRKCAAKAGVSHAAPAHHFNGLISLKAAIIARCYRMFSASMDAKSRQAEASPRAQLLAICEGYLAFSRDHGALFQIMFQPKPKALANVNPQILDELNAESSKSYMILRTACAPFAPVGGHDQGTEVMVWALVHGYAVLFANQPDKETPAGTLPEFAHILPDLPLRN